MKLGGPEPSVPEFWPTGLNFPYHSGLVAFSVRELRDRPVVMREAREAKTPDMSRTRTRWPDQRSF